MGKIATEQEAYNIGKKGTPNGNKCCTKTRAEELGCKVNGSYNYNQLIQLDDLRKDMNTVYLGYKVDDVSNYVVFKINNVYGESISRLVGTPNFPLILPICYMDANNKLSFTVSAPSVDDGRQSVTIDTAYSYNSINVFKITNKPPYGLPKETNEYTMESEIFDYASKKNIYVYTRCEGIFSLT